MTESIPYVAVQQRPSRGGSGPGGRRHPGVRRLRHYGQLGSELRPCCPRRGGDRQPGRRRLPLGAQETLKAGCCHQTKGKSEQTTTSLRIIRKSLSE